MKTFAFIVPPAVELLDLAGPIQVFTEAKSQGFDLAIEFYSYRQEIVSSSGLAFKDLANYRHAALKAGDFLFLPGMNFEYVCSPDFQQESAFFAWIKKCGEQEIVVCSVCNGAFVLGEAGLLSNRNCTTHWRRISTLQTRFPSATVIPDVLFIKEGQVYTSAGMSTGIDLSLSILEDIKSRDFMLQVARGLSLDPRMTA